MATSTASWKRKHAAPRVIPEALIGCGNRGQGRGDGACNRSWHRSERENMGTYDWRHADILRNAAAPDLAFATLSTNLAHCLDLQRKSLHVAFGGMTARGVDRQFATQLDAAALHPLANFTASAESKPFERI